IDSQRERPKKGETRPSAKGKASIGRRLKKLSNVNGDSQGSKENEDKTKFKEWKSRLKPKGSLCVRLKVTTSDDQSIGDARVT
ncbi:1827_t:CDS:2, partial [Scutellospora calospora]